MSLIENLENAPCFKKLQESALRKILGMSRTVHFPPDKVIFSEDDTQRDLFLLLEGRVSIELRQPDKPPVHLLTARPGEIFGWSGFVPPYVKTATAIALESVRALVIDARGLRELCERDYEVGYRICDWLNGLLAERVWATRPYLKHAGDSGDNWSQTESL
ncbi:MAG: cyclic nucleotide-binding domain-containing protein [Candidatus Wallbacteria bacterium]|nr:cyclic nucleotide-binding domain-containing protein [Candidatus Wallbacteria bacterium]